MALGTVPAKVLCVHLICRSSASEESYSSYSSCSRLKRWCMRIDERVPADVPYDQQPAKEETHDFFFTNKTYADIDATSDLVFGDGTFPMSKINEDEWDRVNSYVLRRIVYGDGTPHPVFWPKFLDWYKSTFPGLGIAVMSSNNDCIRRCQYVAPCFVCQPLCGVA